MDIPALSPLVRTPFRVTVGVTLVAAATGIGLAAADVVASGWEVSFLYAAGRSIVFFVIAIAVSVARSPAGAVLAAGALALAQLLDTIIGAMRGDVVYTVVPVVLALVCGVCALWLTSRMRQAARAA